MQRKLSKIAKQLFLELKPYLIKGVLFLLPIFLNPLILVGILYCSPFAVFAPPLSKERDVRVVLKEMDDSYQKELQRVLADMEGFDRIEIHADGWEGHLSKYHSSDYRRISGRFCMMLFWRNIKR